MLRLPAAIRDILGKIDEDRVVDALAAVHARQTQRALEQGLNPDDAAAYARARALLHERDRRVTREAEMIDDLLGQLTGTSAPDRQSSREPEVAVPQQELVLLGEPGGQAAGRFRISNETDRTATFGFVIGVRENGSAAPPVTFTPPSATLAPGSARVVGVRVDLASELGEGSFTIPVEIRVGRDLRQMLWLTVRCVRA